MTQSPESQSPETESPESESPESDEQERAAAAESYGGAPISDAELGDVWTSPDVVSDPARDDGTSSDWSDEGGATPSGPATNVEHDGEPDHDPAPESASGPAGEKSVEPPD